MTSKEDLTEAFLAVANCDADTAERWLRQCAWDIELALRTYFDFTGQPGASNPFELASDSRSRERSSQPTWNYREDAYVDEEDELDIGGDIAADFGVVPFSSPSRSQSRRDPSQARTPHTDMSLAEKNLQPDESYMVTDVPLLKALELTCSMGLKGLLVVLVRRNSFQASLIHRDIFRMESVKDVLASVFTVWYRSFDSQDSEGRTTSEASQVLHNYRITPEDVNVFVLHPETSELMHTFRPHRWRCIESGYESVAFLDDVMTFLETAQSNPSDGLKHVRKSQSRSQPDSAEVPSEFNKRTREEIIDVDDHTLSAEEQEELKAALEQSLKPSWSPRFNLNDYINLSTCDGMQAIQIKIRFPSGEQRLITCVISSPTGVLYDYVRDELIKLNLLESTKVDTVILRIGGLPPRVLKDSNTETLMESGCTANTLITVVFQ